MSRLDDAYASQIRLVKARVEQFARSQFKTGSYRDADLKQFVDHVVPTILAGRRQVALLTDSYLSQVLSEALGIPVKPVGPPDTDALRGVDPSEVYGRPYQTVWTKLSDGGSFDAAVAAGLARVSDLVLTDFQLAKTLMMQKAYSNNDGVAGFRRVLTGRKSCALCYVASTQRYHKEDLLPIHPGCDCSTAPIVSGDRADMDAQLEKTHEAVQDRFGVSDRGARAPDYRQIEVRDHGEIGPVLTVRSQDFTGPSDLPRT